MVSRRPADVAAAPQRHPPAPDFLCIGLQKGGTRWLYDSLATHPDVWLPPVKELHYFDGAFRSHRAREALDRMLKRVISGKSVDTEDLEFLRRSALPTSIDDQQYAELFTATGKQVTGEVTPAYSGLNSQRIQHIAGLFPDLRIILMIRNPIARAWSHLNMDVRAGRAEQQSLADPDRVREMLSQKRFARRSYPSATYRRWAGVFGTDRILVQFFDHLRTQPETVCRSVWDFLDLRVSDELVQGAMVEDVKKNIRRLDPAPEVAELLGETFADEIARCRALFGGPALDW